MGRVHNSMAITAERFKELTEECRNKTPMRERAIKAFETAPNESLTRYQIYNSAASRIWAIYKPWNTSLSVGMSPTYSLNYKSCNPILNTTNLKIKKINWLGRKWLKIVNTYKPLIRQKLHRLVIRIKMRFHRFLPSTQFVIQSLARQRKAAVECFRKYCIKKFNNY